MQRKSFGTMECAIARSLERVGEWWSILILRDAFYGVTRFDEFQQSLGVAPTMLTKRLGVLVEAGLLERRRYQERPPRYEYLLTDRGRDFRPVLLALLEWGNRHFAPDGTSVEIRDARSGHLVETAFVDPSTGATVPLEDIRVSPGPAASERVRKRIERHPARFTEEERP
ncbi:winged helix-turn-helix transcriptional regulator [Lichenifustis flavocetrariae]|uniref:Helix-turn-helix transcriptional regulator n=1 Tax=Lichenifustis flavocetrariae TaxID=2949735 RepID=A0AA42CKF9_9HYPH|nr:helix-turn-helix domain-containing protein [Lichenifustis flavocetrariae]MCW6509211.1 helix-turn-helix transcriptional regulator [Lichenifustis flavocetrariae]